MNALEYQKLALEIRIRVVEMLKHRGFGHIGGSLSIADVLAVLYGSEMNVFPNDPQNPDRDMLVMGKGHAGPAVFAALSIKGFFDKDMLFTLCEGGTKLPSHCDRLLTPGIDVSTGSLGQGFSLACGLAHGFKLQNKTNKIYAILGDGEMQEGEVWEAAMYANHYKLDNLIAYVDWNKKQVDGYTKDVITTDHLEEKFSAFGLWSKTVKGDDCEAILAATKEAHAAGKAAAIILDTVKGAGVDVYANMMMNHFIDMDPELATQGLEQLYAQQKKLEEAQ